jgi:hypothetical protein
MRLVPTSQPALRLVPKGPSPYTSIIEEAEDFQRRAAANTPEAIGRQAVLDVDALTDSAAIPTGLGPSLPQWLARPLIENAPRVGVPLGAAMSLTGVGALPGAAIMGLSGLAGEALSQGIEKEITGSRQEYSGPQMAVGGLLSAAPPLRLAEFTSPLIRGGLRAAEGAGYGALAPTLEAGLEGRLPTREELLTGALAGGVLGAPFGVAEASRGFTVAGRTATDILPTELIPAGQALRDPLVPIQTNLLPAELGAVNQAQAITRAEQAGVRAGNERSVANFDASVDAAKVRALGERMMGKSPADQLAILDQEMRLQKDTLSVAEQRAGLDMKQELKRQIEAQKAMEEAARAEQKAVADQQKAVADAQKAQAEALQPPEMPKSAQILAEPVSKPPALANVATEVATQTKNSPYALQGKLNEMTAAPAPEPALAMPQPEVAPLAGRAPIETDPVKIAADRKEYERVYAELNARKDYGTPEYNAVWQSMEDIKNRHGGMPPATTAAEPNAKPAPLPEPAPTPVANADNQDAPAPKIEEVPVAGRPPAATKAASLRRQQRGAVPAQLLTPLTTGAAGGVTGFTSTEQEAGETDEAFQARRLRNTGIGAAAGLAGGVGISALAKGAQARRAATRAQTSGRVNPPTPGPGQDIRQTAEKIIENRQYPENLRKVLAEDPSIVYDKFALNELGERLAAASDQELIALRASADNNERAGATIELANRYSVNGREADAAALYSEAARQFTAPAQLINVARLVRSPQGFVRAINEQLKDLKRVLSKPQEAELTSLAAKTIKAEQELARAERAAVEDFSAANEAAYRAAQKAAGTAKKAVDDYVHQVSPESFGDITSKIIQGNLLTPLSLVANVFGNMVYQPVRRSATSVATALDAIYSGATNRKRTFDRLIPLPARQELEAAADGIKIAAKELLTGPGVDSYIKAEVQRGFKPMRSLAQAFTGKNLAVREDGSVALTDRAKKFIEGTLGIAPEVMFRFLNLGDKPFRRAAEMEILLEQARLKKLKGRDLQKFLEFPDKSTQNLIETEGRRAIFAQENKGITQLNQFLDSGVAKIIGADQIPALRDAIKIFNRVIVPFRQFPVNYVMTALNFAAPELATAKAVYYAQKGDRRKALQNIGEGALGAMMYGGAAYLWDKGIISEPTDKDAKQRTVQYEQMGPQRINVTGLQRALDGGDGSYQLGDTTMDWGRLGIPASVFYVFTRNAAKGKKDYARLGQQPPTNYATDRLSAIPGMSAFALDQSFLSGTSSFLEAMKNPDPEGQELQNWVRNAFRAVTSIAVPNSVEALSRAEYEYIPDLKGDSLTDTLKNTWDYKVMQLPEGDRAVLKRDVWGDPVRRNPEGKNPYINQFIDVTRTETKTADPFKQRLVDLYQETGTPDVYPTLPQRNLSVEDVTVKLTPQDYEDYQEIVGKLRRQYAERIVNDPRFNAASTIPEQKIMALKAAYAEGAKAGKQQFLARPGVGLRYFPELFGQPVQAPEDSRVVSRGPAARGRLRLQAK